MSRCKEYEIGRRLGTRVVIGYKLGKRGTKIKIVLRCDCGDTSIVSTVMLRSGGGIYGCRTCAQFNNNRTTTIDNYKAAEILKISYGVGSNLKAKPKGYYCPNKPRP